MEETSGSTYAQDSGESVFVKSRGCRFEDTSSTRTPRRNAARMTSAPASGMSSSLCDNDIAAVASKPIPRPARLVLTGSNSKSVRDIS